jgi:hypothetical protein
MRRRLPPPLVLALALAAACTSATGPVDGVFRGIYVNGFEASDFEVCGAERSWWAGGDLAPVFAAWEAQDPVPPGEPRAAYLVVQGQRSKAGSYGHLGAYGYELRVDSVLEVRSDTAGACRPSEGGVATRDPSRRSPRARQSRAR